MASSTTEFSVSIFARRLLWFVARSLSNAICARMAFFSHGLPCAQAWRQSRAVVRDNAVAAYVRSRLAHWVSPAGAIEIAQVRRRLVLLGRHQQAVAAQEIVLLADADMIVASAQMSSRHQIGLPVTARR